MPKGIGKRCWGYTKGQYVVCCREQYRGELGANRTTDGGLFVHYIGSSCECGIVHRERPTDEYSPRPQTPHTTEEPGQDYARLARDLWNGRTLPPRGTAVEEYLKKRGLTSDIPPTLRYAPALLHKNSGRRFEAMVAAITVWPGTQVSAIHRTYLSRGKKAPVTPNKMMLGHVKGGSVWLALPDETLVVGEGIETCLAVLQATGLPTWASLSAANYQSLVLPPLPLASKVIIAADHDDDGLKAARRARERWLLEGRKVFVACPGDGKDFNDELLEAAV